VKAWRSKVSMQFRNDAHVVGISCFVLWSLFGYRINPKCVKNSFIETVAYSGVKPWIASMDFKVHERGAAMRQSLKPRARMSNHSMKGKGMASAIGMMNPNPTRYFVW
jgi:hypothetical protein